LQRRAGEIGINHEKPLSFILSLFRCRATWSLPGSHPESESLDTLSYEKRLAVGQVAPGLAVLQIAAILDGQDPAQMTDQAIVQSVNARFDENSQGLNQAFGLALKTKGEIADELGANFVEYAISADVVDSLFDELGGPDVKISAVELTSILQDLNNQIRRLTVYS
jgi:hypothetical protein